MDDQLAQIRKQHRKRFLESTQLQSWDHRDGRWAGRCSLTSGDVVSQNLTSAERGHSLIHNISASSSDPQHPACSVIATSCNGWRTTAEPWYHVDNPKPNPRLGLRQPKLVFPGVLNLKDVSAETGGFVCVPKSHLLFGARPNAEVATEADYLDLAPFDNFCESEPNGRVGNTAHTQPVLVCTGGRRGTLTIWDPRLVHCSTSSLVPAEQNERASEPDLLRLASFVSLCPASWATPDGVKQKLGLVEQRICANSHIPYAVNTQRRFQAIAFYDGLWADEEALELVRGCAADPTGAAPGDP